MNQAERQLREQLYESNRQLQAITKQAAQQQERIAELEGALSRVFRETVQYAR